MLAFVFDVAGAYFVAKYFKNVWAMIGVAALAGLLSSIVATALVFAAAVVIDSPTFRPGAAIMGGLGGLVWHPIITIVAAFICRRGHAPA
ncbi:MAG: hypothetical protein NTV97_13705 [Alphaproteobacteria bacterium]|nr:hypothetical protein [Alphaproteobacteria bacterium]